METESKYAHALINIWLDDATRVLCNSTRERIRVETEAHFFEAYDDAVAQGLDEDAALSQALASLGSAHEARKRFSKVYVTTDELRDLNFLYGKKRAGKLKRIYLFIYLFVMLFFAIVAGIASICTGETSYLILVLVFGCFPLYESSKYLVRRAYRSGHLKKTILLTLVLTNLPMLVFALVLCESVWSIMKDETGMIALLRSYEIYILIGGVIILCVCNWYEIRFLRKLSRVDYGDEAHTQ